MVELRRPNKEIRAAAASADWSALPPEILHLVAARLELFLDLLSFSSACTSWRSVGAKERLASRRRCPPLLMLPVVEEENSSSSSCLFLSMSPWHHQRSIFKLRLSDSPPCKWWCITTSHGWLMLLDTAAPPADAEIRLLDPLTGASFRLPPLGHILQGDDEEAEDGDGDGEVLRRPGWPPRHESLIHKVAMSSDPAAVAAIVGDRRILSLCRPGHPNWTAFAAIDGGWTEPAVDVVYSGGMFYSLGSLGRVMTFDPRTNVKGHVAPHGVPDRSTTCSRCYLVEPSPSSGGGGEPMLMFVHCVTVPFVGDDDPPPPWLPADEVWCWGCGIRTAGCSLYRLLEGRDGWSSVTDLGDRLVLLDRYRASCVKGDIDMGVLRLEDGAVERLPVAAFNLPLLWYVSDA